MKLWRFLKYELPYLAVFLTGFGIVLAVMAADPAARLHWGNVLYALALLLLLWGCFFIRRYVLTVQAAKQLREPDSPSLSLEAELCREELEALEKAHIRTLNEVQARQNDHYNYIVSWFHEIKTPISVLRLLQQTGMEPRSVGEEISRIEHYVDQALYYAKLDSFNQDYELVNCDLEKIVKELVKDHAKTFITRKIQLRLNLVPTIVQSDAKWLSFILNQLLTNSLKYTAAQGEISIALAATREERLLVLRDNGIGIEPQDVPRIFNRGFTGTNGRVYAHSTGMGLYLAQELSRKLGHYITCVSESGRFTEMTVHFPRNHDAYLDIVAPAKP
ncbi:MAG: histidine kinase [Paenibacillaceae bacterium]|jgi:signal transduction histidine kinase|nr:histidine kinase [Paenibacillaceae bacterium]